ncbi:MAG: hypothetical protein NVSMB57_13880 [Actinomycetota bacterium]
MYALTMRFHLPADTDWSAIPALMQDRARTFYSDMPGLISKAFVYDPETREYGGNYVWESRPALDAFLSSPVVADATTKFGTPTYSIHHVAAFLHRGTIEVPATAPSQG